MAQLGNRTYDTLFLDRDGIINRLRPGDYVKSWDEFEFLPGALNALTKCNAMFRRILVVTNQRGVGKGLMTRQALDEIHRRMLQTIAAHGGRIDKIYCCTGLSENDPCRKPNIGMALQAQKEFPEIDFASALMVGDTSSDLLFGRNAGMHTVLIGEDEVKNGCASVKALRSDNTADKQLSVPFEKVADYLVDQIAGECGCGENHSSHDCCSH